MTPAASGAEPARTPELPPLLQNLTLFGRLLRGIGLPVSTARMLDLAQALPLIEVFRREEFHAAARALLTHRREDLELFDAAFALFWETPPERWTRARLPGMTLRKPHAPVTRATFRPAAPGGGSDPEEAPPRPFARREKPRPLVVLADVSGSMEQTARILLHFLYGLSHGSSGRVEAFVFATRLTRITRKLADRRVDRALREASEAVRDWSGGTRIGEALHRFNLEWARRLPTSSAVVLLVSDGWDRGDPSLVAAEMERLSGLAWRVVWLNPLLADEGYEPLTRGMAAALPHIHDFLPVNNLASVRSLADHLAGLDPVGRAPGSRFARGRRSFPIPPAQAPP